jgi:hypothetical protein
MTHAIGGTMTEETNSAEEQAPEEEAVEEGKKERYRVAGEKLLSKVKELLQEGNIRRITIKNDDDRTLIEIPLTLGVVGAAIFPVWAAVGAIAALVTDCSIEVERHD